MTVMTAVRRWMRWSGAAALAALAGCSSHRPWINQPLPPAAAVSQQARGAERHRLPPAATQPVTMAVTLSGGGARAAAFGLGVLRELKATTLTLDGQTSSLLDHVALVSGVSGGSILAAHFAAFGDATLDRFEPDFLMVPFESRLIREALWPERLYKLTSPWYGRTQILAQRFDELFEGRTFADVLKRPGAPELMITATDLTTGAPFDFTAEQFQLICSDLGATPLSFAVAASSAVPLLLSPVTVRNHADACEHALPAATPAAQDYRARMLQNSVESYRNARDRPYIHLVDGGVTDNLGVRLMLDRLVATGSMTASFADAKPGTIRRLILVTVNSERGLSERVDNSDRIPTTTQVLESLIFGAGSRETQITLAMLTDDQRRWREEIQRMRGQPGSPFAADAEIHTINVSLHDVPDDKIRHSLLRVPTAFTIEAHDVVELQRAGAAALRASPAFVQLKQSLERLGAGH
ncbi:patatin-like phospholipase family protein [Roseateles cellulosilyticus]|uniref:Patatin-like phospholipase family protein n=1 Tax=Pelomonas cellulosilytica TaxID=2906762 RepID=A0ABS8XYT6_9BURK|nr:patatin-like phospholipase family protein [Pelomonas sp. P8]MCE4555946.1 patatin-like phospholipase family protein [Pelomonas sp. P8]